MLRPAIVGMRGSMVIRLRPCMRSSASLLSSTLPPPTTRIPWVSLIFSQFWGFVDFTELVSRSSLKMISVKRSSKPVLDILLVFPVSRQPQYISSASTSTVPVFRQSISSVPVLASVPRWEISCSPSLACSRCTYSSTCLVRVHALAISFSVDGHWLCWISTGRNNGSM